MLWFETARRPGSCGWSGQMNTPKSPIFTTENLFWAAIPMPSAPGLTFKLVADILTPTLCHEMAESFTDRNGNGWVAPNGCEIGDVCENESADRLGHWRIERYWSDADLVCFPVVHGMPYSTFLLQTGTPIGAADGAANFGWAVADFNGDGIPDLFGIKTSNTGTGSVEVHVLDGATRYQSFLLQTGTPIGAADGAANFGWAVADFNGDGIPDLFGIKTSNTGTGSVEVHVLDGATRYQSFLLQTGTPIGAADGAANFGWAVADFNGDGIPDLFGIKTSNTGTGSVEVHVLDGATRYQSFLLQTGTPIGAANFGWGMGDFNGDGMADLFGIKATSTGTKTLEIHVLDSASSYQKFLLQTGTKVTQGDVSNFHFLVAPLNRGGIADVFALRTQAVPSGKLQVRVLDDLDDFQSFALQAGTPIDATDAAVNFSWAAADFDRDGVSDLYGIKTGNTGTGTVEVHVLGGIGAPRVPTRRVFPVGDPIGYATDVPRMVYRGVDNHIYELAIYPSTGSWGLFDM